MVLIAIAGKCADCATRKATYADRRAPACAAFPLVIERRAKTLRWVIAADFTDSPFKPSRKTRKLYRYLTPVSAQMPDTTGCTEYRRCALPRARPTEEG